MYTDIFERIRKSTGGPIGQYREKAEGYFAFPKLEGELGPNMRFNGQDVLCWSLNNYLGLANHPEIRKADAEAAARWGLAYPMGSRMMTGQTHLHEELERRLAAFEKKEAAFEFNFGYQGIVSTIDALVGRHDVIVYDAEDHACLLDGIRLHVGSKYKFRHNDIKDCERVIAKACEEAEKKGGGVLLITEGVFGMTGALGILDQIAALKKKYQFRIMIDDAHGFGVMGEHGRGTSEHFGVMDEIDIYIGAYAKSMAIIGGFVAADKDTINWVRHTARSYIFQASCTPASTAAALEALHIFQDEPERQENLWKITNYALESFRQAGFEIGETESPIIPLYVRDTEKTFMATKMAFDAGVFINPVIPPACAPQDTLLRFALMATHTKEQVDIAVEKLTQCFKALEIIK